MYKYFFKRFFDVIFALLLLIPLMPIMLIVALVIKLDSKGANDLWQKGVS